MSDPGPISIAVAGDAPSGAPEFAELAAEVVNATATELEMPPAHATFVFTNDFSSAVHDALARSGRLTEQFDTARVGGTVGLKTISLDGAGAESEIIFNIAAWPAHGDGLDGPRGHRLLTHELVHVLLSRLQYASGFTDDVRRLAYGTPRPVVEAGIRKAVEELRCDLFANQLYAGRAEFPDGEMKPLVNLMRLGYVEAFEQEALAEIAEGWPQLVADARCSGADPVEPALVLVSRVDPILNLLARADAEAFWLGYRGLLGIPEIAEHPAMSEMIGPVWSAITDAVETNPLPKLTDFAKAERTIIRAGFDAVLEMFARLGLYLAEPSTGAVVLKYM